MISIIICSRRNAISEDLSTNIEKTIGCEYELIVIDNSENKYSIFEAYNIGIEKSIGNLLCFIHDDILFHTKNWGDVVTHIFDDDKKIGLLGIAGAKVKTKMPSAWWDCRNGENFTYIIQHFKNKEKEKWNFGFDKNTIEEVVAIDGVFMVTRKNNQISFDETMKGFHNYDLNISFEVIKQNLKIVVTNKILVEHFSIGTINNKWLQSTYQIHKKYKKMLPLSMVNFKDIKKIEIENAKRFINQCLNFSQYKLAFLVWLQLFLLSPFLKFHLRFWFNYLKKNFI